MTANQWIGALFLLLALIVALALAHDVLVWVRNERGRRAADHWWIQTEQSVEETQREMWKREALPPCRRR
jgi:hypothetical protein